MYTIYSDGKAVYSPLLVNDGYCVLSPKLTVELNKSGSLSFVQPPANVMYDSIQKLKSIITVMQDDEEIFRGRVLYDEKDFYNRKNIYCEGELSFLVDSVVRPYSFQGGVRDLFTQYLDNHNSQVDEEKQFQVGIVTVTDPNDYITRESSDYPKSLDEMKAKLLDLLGGYFRPRLENGIRYLDYVTDYGNISDQVIEFGTNLLDLTEYVTAEDVFTVLIPLGAELEDDEGNSTGRLTIESVNDGKDYIEDDAAVALFGHIWKVQEWDDVTIAENLLSKGTEYLSSGIEMAVSLSIKAIDLHLLNVDTSRIRLGNQVRVVSLPHKLDKYFLCSKISYDLVNPQNTEYTLGVTFASMTDKQINQQKAAQNIYNTARAAEQSAKNSMQKADNAVRQVDQVIAQIPSEYVKTVDFNAYKQELDEKMEGFASAEEIPKKTSELENDSNFISGADADKKYADLEAFDALKARVDLLDGGGLTSNE